MNLQVSQTNKIQGTVTPPSSKSQTIRAIIFATLATGESRLTNALESDDTIAAISVCESLGAKIVRTGQNLIITSVGIPLVVKDNKLNSGNSGITTRFIMPVLGLRQNSDQKIILDCGEQMKQRPVQPLITALNNLGMEVNSINNNGVCPLQVKGKLEGGKIRVDGLSSQYLSALLMSLSGAVKDSIITVENLQERPYVAMTLTWLDEQGIKYKHKQEDGLDIYEIKGGQKYSSFNKVIPGDFSSASYLIAAGVLIPGKLIINGLDMNDKQGDKRLIEILQAMGADIQIERLKIIINGAKRLIGREIDCNDIPDMVPTLAVIATQAQGVTKITNVGHARIKETDRLHSMAEGLSKLGAEIEEKENGLVIYQSKLQGTKVSGCNDHRTVMALALAGMLAEGETNIDTAESVNKTFPNFVELMQNIGANINSSPPIETAGC